LWFVILIPFYLTNTITQLFNKYNNTANLYVFTAKLLYLNNTTLQLSHIATFT
jgi:hypothetical protein